jgi:hypothetical protein
MSVLQVERRHRPLAHRPYWPFGQGQAGPTFASKRGSGRAARYPSSSAGGEGEACRYRSTCMCGGCAAAPSWSAICTSLGDRRLFAIIALPVAITLYSIALGLGI